MMLIQIFELKSSWWTVMKKLRAMADWRKVKTGSLSERHSWHKPFSELYRNYVILLVDQ